MDRLSNRLDIIEWIWRNYSDCNKKDKTLKQLTDIEDRMRRPNIHQTAISKEILESGCCNIQREIGWKIPHISEFQSE